ncbi:hypothetical protein BamIOP4010DRAFT_2351 [Burkholderia ambifaria IOP40-10]|uniref:Uncharacterized protein n=1 Tax=Burkholderia ambifaria IOP40-10 TaxID=396596 RepID=B1FE91_9BURK|nr:hypothetical protein [Burkholderia ambifaria]EDT04118.1 hypothetical protein BamIOP4010DRAFT_2351 [Burkholderia ambifaria IOP40-10]
MQGYYFVSRQPDLGPAVIPPGRWGRAYDDYAATRIAGGDPWRLVIEQAVELERLRNFPDRPSRFNASFLFLSLDTAKRASRAWSYGASPKVVWSAEPVDISCPHHLGDFTLLEDIDGKCYADIKARACRYWRGPHHPESQEFVTSSPIRLVKRICAFTAERGWFSISEMTPQAQVVAPIPVTPF